MVKSNLENIARTFALASVVSLLGFTAIPNNFLEKHNTFRDSYILGTIALAVAGAGIATYAGRKNKQTNYTTN
jgi:hypothetical protein